MATQQPRLFINPSPDTPGHVVMRDERGELVDTAGGPRDSMIRIYLASGYRVFDVDGREWRTS